MSGGVLLAAAALMRERAMSAGERRPSPWLSGESSTARVVRSAHRDYGPMVCMSQARPADHVFPHIASWHPAVALAVAEMLESVARTDAGRSQRESHEYCDEDCDVVRALNVAHAYLGAASREDASC